MNQANDTENTITAAEFVEMLKSGETLPEGLVVEGDVHLGTAKFDHDIHLGNTEFRGDFCCDEAIIKDFYCDEAFFNNSFSYGNATIINFSCDSASFVTSSYIEAKKRSRLRRRLPAAVILWALCCFPWFLLVVASLNSDPSPDPLPSDIGLALWMMGALALIFIVALGLVLGFVHGFILGLVFAFEFGPWPVGVVAYVSSIGFGLLMNSADAHGLINPTNNYEFGLVTGLLLGCCFIIGFGIGYGVRRLSSWIRSKL